MKFTEADLRRANARLAMLQYYPAEPMTQAAICELLAKICPSLEALEWLVDQMVNRVGQWKGPAELRGVLCWRFRPADGIEGNSTIAGFTAADGEQISLDRHAQLKAGGWCEDSERLIADVRSKTKAIPAPQQPRAAPQWDNPVAALYR